MTDLSAFAPVPAAWLEALLALRARLGAQAVLTWAPASQQLAGWRYTPSVSGNTGFTQTTGQADRQLVGLQAAQQSYTRIAGLSLFDYLR